MFCEAHSSIGLASSSVWVRLEGCTGVRVADICYSKEHARQRAEKLAIEDDVRNGRKKMLVYRFKVGDRVKTPIVDYDWSLDERTGWHWQYGYVTERGKEWCHIFDTTDPNEVFQGSYTIRFDDGTGATDFADSRLYTPEAQEPSDRHI